MSVVLARILTPGEFGVVAMVTVFLAISEVIVQSGFTAALIQKAAVTDEDTSSVFYFNISRGATSKGHGHKNTVSGEPDFASGFRVCERYPLHAGLWSDELGGPVRAGQFR